MVNAENVAGGFGITPKIADELLAAGVDAITLGNHGYRHREIYPYLDKSRGSFDRPTTCADSRAADTRRRARRRALAVVNLSGNLYMRAGRSAFSEIDAVLAELREKADHIIVDMHAEATSEKVAFGWHLDGRVTAVLGTHTHVPTADARVLPGGTAYITDVGMTGARGGRDRVSSASSRWRRS